MSNSESLPSPLADSAPAPSPALPPTHTLLRGEALLNEPLLNKGTAFSRQERQALGLEALLPWQEESLAEQVERCRRAFAAMGSDLERYAYAQSLR